MALRLAFICCLLTCSQAQAAQFVLIDDDYIHDGGSHAWAKPSAETPADWVSTEYAKGSMHMRVELKAMPSDSVVHFAICYVTAKSYACSAQRSMQGPKVYTWDQKLETFWQYDKVDWSKPVTDVALVFRDANNAKIDPGQGFIGDPDYSAYFPLSQRVTITMVSEGASYVEPVEVNYWCRQCQTLCPVTMGLRPATSGRRTNPRRRLRSRCHCRPRRWRCQVTLRRSILRRVI